jgi:N-acetylmuramoyl-L-alanine amidase
MSHRFIRPFTIALLYSTALCIYAAEGEASKSPGTIKRGISAIKNIFGSDKKETPVAEVKPATPAVRVQSSKPTAKVKLSTTAAKTKSSKSSATSSKSSTASSKAKSTTAKKPVVKAVPYDSKTKEKSTATTTAEKRSSAKPGTPSVSETAESTTDPKPSKTDPIPLTAASGTALPPPVPPVPEGSRTELVGPPFISDSRTAPTTRSEQNAALQNPAVATASATISEKIAEPNTPANTLSAVDTATIEKNAPATATVTGSTATPTAADKDKPTDAMKLEPAPSVSATPQPVSKSLDDQFGLNSKQTKPIQQGATTNVTQSNVATLDEETAQAKADDPDSGVTTPLPTFDGKWEIKKYNGHDFVSAQSIQRFYGFSKLTESGNKFILKSSTMFISGRTGESSIQINNVKFVLSYPVADIGGRVFFSRLDLAKLLHPVLRPSYISKGPAFDTVVIDAGHGGHDSGARGVYGYEKDYTLQLAKALAATLKRNGLKVVLTRDTDVFISRPGRVEIANNIPNSIFVSLHFNSGSSAASGLETYALTPAGTSSTDMGQKAWDSSSFRGNSQDSANIALATAIHAYTLHILNKDGGLAAGPSRKKHYFIDRGVKRARWTVLTGCNRPGILFEGGFVTHGTEGQFIAFPAFRQAMANAIAQGIINFRAALNPSMAKRNK